MATIQVCDFCKNTPRDLEAESGGDVRHVTLTVGERIERDMIMPQVDPNDAPQHWQFDMCRACRMLHLGHVMNSIPGQKIAPPTKAAFIKQRLLGDTVLPVSPFRQY